MIHHPNDTLILKFSKAEIFSPLASMVSAHIEKCYECREKYQNYLNQESLEEQNSKNDADLNGNDIANALHLVMNKIGKENDILSPPKRIEEVEDFFIEVSGEKIQLPRSMNFLKKQTIPWKEFGKKNAIAPVVVTKEGTFYLIYIGPGEAVPHHGHTEIEYSYVAAGAFEDGLSSYETGDFSFTNNTHYHTPKALSDDGCLVISWVEGRLNFFTGFLRPLNNLLWWYLHKA